MPLCSPQRDFIGLDSLTRFPKSCLPQQMCPAPGQGALAIQTRRDDPAREICAQLNDEPTSQAVTCERTVLAALGGGCQLPVGAFAEAIGGTLKVIAVVLSPDGTRCLRARADWTAPPS